jgi:hypothetical protein
MRYITHSILWSWLLLMLIFALMNTPGCDSGERGSDSGRTDSITTPGIKMSGNMNEWLSDGCFGLLGDTVLTGPFRVAVALPSKQSGKKADEPNSGAATMQFRHDKIYIDSVPRGAIVNLLPRNQDEGDVVELGRTPLILDPSQTPSMRFLILMILDDYLKTVEGVKELKDWLNRFRLVKAWGGTTIWTQYFEFDTSALMVVPNESGGTFAVGPIYNLEWPMYHRLVALFIPKDVKLSIFYPFMPPPGTFKFNAQTYGASLQKYNFSVEQKEEAVGTLSRCGKYVTKLTVPGQTNTAYIYNVSVQKGRLIYRITERQ